MLDKLTKEAFLPRKGETFSLSVPDAAQGTGALELELAEVCGSGLQGKAEREQFALHFNGPRDPVLAQSIYRLENAEMGALDLFLVPIGRDDRRTIYEAVFT